MKTLVTVWAALSIAVAHAELAPDPQAQAKALERYPQLAVSGSDFNRAFVEKVRDARERSAAVLNDPTWPLLIAEKVAKQLGTKPVEQMQANSGAIEELEPQEIAKGEYEITIWGADSKPLKGRMTGVQAAAAAERSKTLFISVAEPKKYGTIVNIHGNAASYSGLGTVPTVGWSGR